MLAPVWRSQHRWSGHGLERCARGASAGSRHPIQTHIIPFLHDLSHTARAATTSSSGGSHPPPSPTAGCSAARCKPRTRSSALGVGIWVVTNRLCDATEGMSRALDTWKITKTNWQKLTNSEKLSKKNVREGRRPGKRLFLRLVRAGSKPPTRGHGAARGQGQSLRHAGRVQRE